MLSLIKKTFGNKHKKQIKSFQKIIDEINNLENSFELMSDEELASQTKIFKNKIHNEGVSLDDILIETFAIVREVSKRVLGLRHFDVQLMGGIALHQGMIAEMKTGEGKTLVATLPAYLNALSGNAVHIITVNEYLAQRDANEMGAIFNFLGLSVGSLISGLSKEDTERVFDCDIIYGTNNEFGFSYLRDNMRAIGEKPLLKKLSFAIIDEVDSILIDEARTPLIISGIVSNNTPIVKAINGIVKKIDKDSYEIDEKSKSIWINDEGNEVLEQLVKDAKIISQDKSLHDLENLYILQYIQQALRAYHLFTKDIDYLIKDQQLYIIDEFTGRIMEGRRYSEGLHQALEAKENLQIREENQTLATITLQNYFRLYDKISGMTGTATTEKEEFAATYNNIQVCEIPTNQPVTRKDDDDEIYCTYPEKEDSIVKFISELHEKGQPILVGTASIESSEKLSKRLKKEKISHNVLNAKYWSKEAEIIAQAGRYKAVTIATNMAGRGTDIMLGGSLDLIIQQAFKKKKLQDKDLEHIRKTYEEERTKVIEAGGLAVLGTERHESRRIDNQLRGRSGRQGDVGYTRFFLSMDDSLMRVFGSEKIQSLLSTLGMKNGESIHHPWLSKAIESAQKKVESQNYEIRKNLIRFDDVMNEQRQIFYEERNNILDFDLDFTKFLQDIANDLHENIVFQYIAPTSPKYEWNIEELTKRVSSIYSISIDIESCDSAEDVINILNNKFSQIVDNKICVHEKMPLLLRNICLTIVDDFWKDHLLNIDFLKKSIRLQAFAQKDPFHEYKKQSLFLFNEMFENISQRIIFSVIRFEIQQYESAMDFMIKQNSNKDIRNIKESHSRVKFKKEEEVLNRVSRNANCPCGSDKKYKRCCGSIT